MRSLHRRSYRTLGLHKIAFISLTDRPQNLERWYGIIKKRVVDSWPRFGSTSPRLDPLLKTLPDSSWLPLEAARPVYAPPLVLKTVIRLHQPTSIECILFCLYSHIRMMSKVRRLSVLQPIREEEEARTLYSKREVCYDLVLFTLLADDYISSHF